VLHLKKTLKNQQIQIAGSYNTIWLLLCCTSCINLIRLLSGTGELCGIEYFKLVFLKYLNMPTWSIFVGLVTIVIVLFSDGVPYTRPQQNLFTSMHAVSGLYVLAEYGQLISSSAYYQFSVSEGSSTRPSGDAANHGLLVHTCIPVVITL